MSDPSNMTDTEGKAYFKLKLRAVVEFLDSIDFRTDADIFCLAHSFLVACYESENMLPHVQVLLGDFLDGIAKAQGLDDHAPIADKTLN